MENLTLKPELEDRPDYDDSSRYNHGLYSSVELTGEFNRMRNHWLQLSSEMGRLMLSSMDMVGVPQIFTDGPKAHIDAFADISERTAREFEKPEFGLIETQINDEKIAITEEIVEGHDHAFGRLLHFKRQTDRCDPPVLIAAPMSGHYATLLRDTVKQLLPCHDVYITDWKNARDVPVSEGEFGLDEYIDYLKGFIKEIGPDTNIIAVCQSTVPMVAAVSHLAQTEPDWQPNSMTLIGGPLDTEATQTVVTEFADEHPIEWFRDTVTAKVPDRYKGFDRLVYPGFMQLASFMGMNLDNHLKKQRELYGHLVSGDHEQADKIKVFYDEYRSVCDMDRPFYLETVDKVFIRNQLARNEFAYRGDRVDPSKVTKTAVFTIEGMNDDISAPGQTSAAHSWFTGINPEQHSHLLQEDTGHYGLFSGSKWRNEISPRIAGFIHETTRAKGGPEYDPIPEESTSIMPDFWPLNN